MSPRRWNLNTSRVTRLGDGAEESGSGGAGREFPMTVESAQSNGASTRNARHL